MHSPAEYNPHKDVTHYKLSPTSTRFSPRHPRSHHVGLRAIAFHLQQRYLSPAKYLSTIITSLTATVSGLETWSDSASEETYIFYYAARDCNRLQIFLTRPPGNYQILSSRIYEQDP